MKVQRTASRREAVTPKSGDLKKAQDFKGLRNSGTVKLRRGADAFSNAGGKAGTFNFSNDGNLSFLRT